MAEAGPWHAEQEQPRGMARLARQPSALPPATTTPRAPGPPLFLAVIRQGAHLVRAREEGPASSPTLAHAHPLHTAGAGGEQAAVRRRRQAAGCGEGASCPPCRARVSQHARDLEPAQSRTEAAVGRTQHAPTQQAAGRQQAAGGSGTDAQDSRRAQRAAAGGRASRKRVKQRRPANV